MFYKALGYVTWQVAKRYARKKAPSRRSLLLGVLGVTAVGAALTAVARRDEPHAH